MVAGDKTHKCEREAKLSGAYMKLIIANKLECPRLWLVGNVVRIKNKNSRRIVVGNSYERVTRRCMKMEQDETGILRENGS